MANVVYRLKRPIQTTPTKMKSWVKSTVLWVTTMRIYRLIQISTGTNFSEEFVTSLGLDWNPYTTQIEPHDYIAEYFDAVVRF